MNSDGDVKRLIVHHYFRAEEHAAAGNFGDDLIAYDLHFKNCDRLVTCEYVQLGRSGLIAPFLLKPTNRQKYEAVVAALGTQGIRSEAISVARFSVLVPSAGVVKHALFPKIDALTQRITWVREATEALYLHYFNEPMPPTSRVGCISGRSLRPSADPMNFDSLLTPYGANRRESARTDTDAKLSIFT